MEIKKVIPSGYCKGVVNAIRLAKKTREEHPKDKIFILGMLVHNSFVTDELTAMGIITLDGPRLSKEELLDQIAEGIVIFTAHGIADSVKEKAIAKGLKYVDASCEDVLKTQDIIKEHIAQGYDVIYFGKHHHPEAEAVCSISGKIHLISSRKELQELRISSDKIFLTNQTTMSFLELAGMIEEARKIFPDIEVQQEICNATSTRQQAIRELKDCDLLYVVGDKRSNNTGRLVDIAEKSGIKKVLLIQSYQDIDLRDCKDKDHIYVTAGASTPPALINEVISYLRAELL